MSEDAPRHFDNIEEWRNWLKENHQTAEPIWIIIQKKASEKTGIRYEEAVLEAVAYGWIDGKIKRIDDDEFMQYYAPRRPDSVWSISNKRRVERLIKEKRMTPAGLKAVEDAKKSGWWEKAYTSRAPTKVPEDLQKALEENPEADTYFEAFPPSAKFMYIHWINEAKRGETRLRRINTVVYRAERNQKPGIDLKVVNP